MLLFTEISNCESDIVDLAARHDPATRQWLLKDFDKWFSDPGDSRAYVLVGDPGVGKSVMAGVLAQRSREAGHLGAAYFCHHNDNTRNDPRYLLGTIASQLCECSSEYNSIMGGEGGIRKLLGNCNLGVQELFTKLLQEPLGKCKPTLCHRRKLVVIDALDETQYESREDFLDLLMNRFPLLPNWLAFFITSRPENTLLLRLKKYNPCVRICAGNVEHDNFYQQHEQDIKLFLRNNVDFSRLPFTVDDLVKKCSGLFLYAFCIAKDLNAPMQSGESFQLDDVFPGDFDNFLRKNFKRVFGKVGSSLFKKLFGCAIAAPARLPVSFISYVLQREKSSISKQHVLDALSLFMVLSKTFTFLHNLIPAWLTDEDKACELFIDRNIEASYLIDVILEILSSFIREQSQDVTLIKLDLLDYVLRLGIRFLSGFPGKNSLETVFNCLTSFKYIEKRIQSRRNEIYFLIEDYKLAADCQGEGKKEILLEVCSALERNIYVLLGCPHLLHSCLQNTSKVIQDNVDIPDSVSTTWLQLSQSMPLPSNRLRHQSNFAVSPDGKLVGERHWKHLFLFDSYSHQCVGVFSSIEFERYLVPGSKCLEFSPDGKFLFFGRLDRWFSLENKTVETFPQFSKFNSSYEWGSFTLDKQYIVVKRCNFLFQSNNNCCWLCLLNYLCLWAAEEIGQGLETDESKTICGCFPRRLQVQTRSSADEEKCSPVPAMRILLNILRRAHRVDWCSLLEKLQLIDYPFEVTCLHCPSRVNRETITLTGVRDVIISHYNEIFKYQVWDLQTGRSALERAFSSGVQLTPFTYLCHLRTAVEKCGLLFSGIDESLSLCNIALLNTVCHHLFFFECFRRSFIWKEFGLFEKFSIINSLTVLNSVVDGLFDEAGVKTAGQRSEWVHRKLLVELERVNRIKQINVRLARLEVLAVLEISDSQHKEYVEWLEELERREALERSKEMEQMQVLERIEEQQQRKLLEQRGEQEHLQQLKLLERLERFTQLERLGQSGQLEEIVTFQEFLIIRYWKEVKAILERETLPELDKLLEREKRPELDKLLEREKLLELARLLEREKLPALDKLLEQEKLPKLETLLQLDTLLERKKLPELDKLLEREKLLERKLKILEDHMLELEEFIKHEAPREGEVLELFRTWKLLLTPSGHLHHSWPKRFSQFKQLVHLFWYSLQSNEKILEEFHFGSKTFTNAPLELPNLLDVKEKGLFSSILPRVSPDGKWMAFRLKSEETTVQLYQRQHYLFCRNLVHVIKEVKYFAFTNDSVFVLYLTVQRSLHTLSLASGTILTSVSGVRPLFFTPQRQAGYSFQVDDKESIILLKDFPTWFLSSFFPFLRTDPMQVTFASADAVLVLYSDSTLALMENHGTAFAWETPLTHSFGGSQKVKKAQFSPDGKLIATHQGSRILLYCTMPASAEASSDHGKFPDSVFKAEDDFTVLHFTISADSTLLLFCIRRSSGLSFFVWNVRKKVLSASVDSPELTSDDLCFCFSSNNTELIICAEFYIEFWDHSSHPCRLLRRSVTGVPNNEVYKLTHCALSPENDLLAYCSGDRILLCSLETSTDQCILELPCAHLGKVEFCQFLRGNRYLISYGVDGTVFLWDLSEWKAVGFAKIAQGRGENIVSMAVSSEEDKVVCVTSFGRLNVVKLCGLKDTLLSNLPLPKGMDSEKMTEAFRGQAREPTAAIPKLRCADNTEDLDTEELRKEEMDIMFCSDDNEYSDEDTE